MAVYALGSDVPDIHPHAWVHPEAVVIGRVRLGAWCSVWPCAVLRADSAEIVVGARTSVQDGVVVHVGTDLPTVVGSGCVVGHLAHLEGCTVGDGALVGSGSVLLHGVEVGEGALVAAGAVLTPGTRVPPLALAKGVPARITPDAVAPGAHDDAAERYVQRAHRYAAELRRLA